MRFPRILTALSTTLLLGITPVALVAQATQPIVEVKTAESTTVWYADPFWLGLGALAVLIIIVLAIMAARSEPKTTTTVIR